MKVSAHPLMVAVALGLLGPGALADDAREGLDEGAAIRPAADDADALDRDTVERGLADRDGPTWGLLTLHDDAEVEGWAATSRG